MAQVKLKQVGTDPEVVQEFELEHANRILNVRHPQKTWELKDPAYKMDKGQIVPVEVKTKEEKK